MIFLAIPSLPEEQPRSLAPFFWSEYFPRHGSHLEWHPVWWMIGGPESYEACSETDYCRRCLRERNREL